MDEQKNNNILKKFKSLPVEKQKAIYKKIAIVGGITLGIGAIAGGGAILHNVYANKTNTDIALSENQDLETFDGDLEQFDFFENTPFSNGQIAQQMLTDNPQFQQMNNEIYDEIVDIRGEFVEEAKGMGLVVDEYENTDLNNEMIGPDLYTQMLTADISGKLNILDSQVNNI